MTTIVPIFEIGDLVKPIVLSLLVAGASLVLGSDRRKGGRSNLARASLVLAGWSVLCIPSWALKEAFERGAIVAGLDHPGLWGTTAGGLTVVPLAILLWSIRWVGRRSKRRDAQG